MTTVHPKTSTLGIKYPALRDNFFQTGDIWFDGKRIDDKTDGYWRIYDKLYDFSTFIAKHPGGPDWLQITKGTDITEAFEAHHISTYPESLLKNYYVRDADERRDSPFTFEDDGFYKTLKRQVREKLKDIPQSVAEKSKLTSDVLLSCFLISALVTFRSNNWYLAILSGILLGMTSISAHNFFHQRNSFRMYYFDLTFMSSRAWRISHVLSHHLHTNTIKDYEISAMEPFFQFLPHDKTTLVRYATTIFSPLIYALTFFVHYFFHVYQFIRRNESLRPESLLTFALFFVLYIFSPNSLGEVFKTFIFMQFVASLHCISVALNVGHHDPELFHDGDVPRPKTELDWGVHQVDTIVGSTTTTGNQFVVLTSFGDHALHHLFPTIDQGKLKYLYPIFNETCKEFGVELKHKTSPQLVWAFLMQLMNNNPNKVPPKPLKIAKTF